MREGWEVIVTGDSATIRPLNPRDVVKVAKELVSALGKDVKTVTDGGGMAFVVPAAAVELFAPKVMAEAEDVVTEDVPVEPKPKRGRPRKIADVEV